MQRERDQDLRLLCLVSATTVIEQVKNDERYFIFCNSIGVMELSYSAMYQFDQMGFMGGLQLVDVGIKSTFEWTDLQVWSEYEYMAALVG